MAVGDPHQRLPRRLYVGVGENEDSVIASQDAHNVERQTSGVAPREDGAALNQLTLHEGQLLQIDVNGKVYIDIDIFTGAEGGGFNCCPEEEKA
jgi:hypothetical protein